MFPSKVGFNSLVVARNNAISHVFSLRPWNSIIFYMRQNIVWIFYLLKSKKVLLFKINMRRKISLRFKILIKKSDWWNLINYTCGFCCVVIYYEIYIIVKTKVEKKSLYVAMCLMFVLNRLSKTCIWLCDIIKFLYAIFYTLRFMSLTKIHFKIFV